MLNFSSIFRPLPASAEFTRTPSLTHAQRMWKRVFVHVLERGDQYKLEAFGVLNKLEQECDAQSVFDLQVEHDALSLERDELSRLLKQVDGMTSEAVARANAYKARAKSLSKAVEKASMDGAHQDVPDSPWSLMQHPDLASSQSSLVPTRQDSTAESRLSSSGSSTDTSPVDEPMSPLLSAPSPKTRIPEMRGHAPTSLGLTMEPFDMYGQLASPSQYNPQAGVIRLNEILDKAQNDSYDSLEARSPLELKPLPSLPGDANYQGTPNLFMTWLDDSLESLPSTGDASSVKDLLMSLPPDIDDAGIQSVASMVSDDPTWMEFIQEFTRRRATYIQTLFPAAISPSVELGPIPEHFVTNNSTIQPVNFPVAKHFKVTELVIPPPPPLPPRVLVGSSPALRAH